MLEFYRKAAAVFFGLIVLTVFSAYICIGHIFVSDPLFPAQDSAIPWKLETVTDADLGGSSSVTVHEDTYSLDYEYYLTKNITFPFVFVVIAFAELENAEHLVDLSKYSTATFRVRCTPRNILALYVNTFDENFTDPAIFDSYRIASESFLCNEEWSEIEIALRHMKVPLWWLEKQNTDISDQDYRLDKVIAITFVNSVTGPVDKLARVKISELTLHGRDWQFAWGFAGFFLFEWTCFIVWFVKRYTASLIVDVRDKLNKDRPLIAYQQLSIEPHKDGEKSRVLRFMATEYANPDMSLEFIMGELGIGRTQLNKLLKDEFGMTFSVYLNKLRLTEAARLLSHKDDANVAEIAYSVGYHNVSYFNKLFKKEYGCTPKTFKGLH